MVMWGWASYDIDDDDHDYVAQTDVHSDGSVHRYEATDGDWSTGHGHSVSSDMDSYLSGETTYDRDPYDSSSIGRSWDDRH